MIFQHTWEAVLSGQKTQTRRIVKPEHSDVLAFNGALHGYPLSVDDAGKLLVEMPQAVADVQPISYIESNGRKLYAVGHAYAVQPGRGQKSVGRIEVVNIRREDVRRISAMDAHAEGFQNIDCFLATWVMMHDKSMNLKLDNRILGGFWTFKHASAWDGCDYGMLPKVLKKRPNERYQAWVIEFKLIKATK